MKKNFFKFSLLMVAAAVSFSCEEPEAEGVSFTSKLNQMTRATSTNFEDSDEIGVTAFSDAEMNTGFATNKQYTYSNGKFTSTDPIRNDNEVALIYRAVYPYQAGVGETFTFTANVDQSAHESYTESDLMTATTEATTATEPELSFYHKMTNVVVNITSADVALANVMVTAEAQNAASVNLRTNAYAGTGSTTTITFGDNGNNSYRAIVAPQTVAAGVDFINITVNGVDYTLPTEEAMELRSGVQYSFDAVIRDGEIEFTSVVNPWDYGNTITYARATALLFGNEGDGIDHASILLAPEGVIDDSANIIGDGKVMQLYLLFNETAEIAEGTYPVEEFNGISFNAGTAISGIEGQDGPIGTSTWTSENSQRTDYTLISEGSITVAIKDGKHTVSGNVMVNEEKVEFYYSGALMFIDAKPSPDDAYEFETKDVTTETFTFTTATKADNQGVIYLTLDNSTITSSIAIIPTDVNNINGTYTFNDSMTAGSAIASVGSPDGESVYPSFIGTKGDGGYIAQPMWYIVGGSITVADSGITLAATSYFGSTLNGTAPSLVPAPVSMPLKTAMRVKVPAKISYRLF